MPVKTVKTVGLGGQPRGRRVGQVDEGGGECALERDVDARACEALANEEVDDGTRCVGAHDELPHIVAGDVAAVGLCVTECGIMGDVFSEEVSPRYSIDICHIVTQIPSHGMHPHAEPHREGRTRGPHTHTLASRRASPGAICAEAAAGPLTASAATTTRSPQYSTRRPTDAVA